MIYMIKGKFIEKWRRKTKGAKVYDHASQFPNIPIYEID
jgi:hypothetical protein